MLFAFPKHKLVTGTKSQNWQEEATSNSDLGEFCLFRKESRIQTVEIHTIAIFQAATQSKGKGGHLLGGSESSICRLCLALCRRHSEQDGGA